MELGYIVKENNSEFIRHLKIKYEANQIPAEVLIWFDIFNINGDALHWQLIIKDSIKLEDINLAREVLEMYDWPISVRLGKTQDKKGYVSWLVPVRIPTQPFSSCSLEMKMYYHRTDGPARIQYFNNTRGTTVVTEAVRARWFIEGKAIRTDQQFKKIQITRLRKVGLR